MQDNDLLIVHFPQRQRHLGIAVAELGHGFGEMLDQDARRGGDGQVGCLVGPCFPITLLQGGQTNDQGTGQVGEQRAGLGQPFTAAMRLKQRLVGLVDNSVRFVSNGISPATWWAACTIAGSEVLGPDWSN